MAAPRLGKLPILQSVGPGDYHKDTRERGNVHVKNCSSGGGDSLIVLVSTAPAIDFPRRDSIRIISASIHFLHPTAYSSIVYHTCPRLMQFSFFHVQLSLSDFDTFQQIALGESRRQSIRKTSLRHGKEPLGSHVVLSLLIPTA